MHVSSVGYLDQKGLKTIEDYNVQTRYDNASLFGQIEHNPIDIEEAQNRNIFVLLRNLCLGKDESIRKQAIDMIA